MTRHEFEGYCLVWWERMCDRRDEAGAEYADDSDAHSNFKEYGLEAGVMPEQAWMVLATKHWRAIRRFLRARAPEYREILERRESAVERVDDLIAYLILLRAMLDPKGTDMLGPSPENRPERGTVRKE
jgi:hypothetical protein